MDKSLCKPYVRWFNGLTNGRWATWEPGDQVDVGDVGWFDDQLEFRHNVTLSDLGIPMTVSEEEPSSPRLYFTAKDFDIGVDTNASLPATGHPVNLKSAGVTFKTKRNSSYLLQADAVTDQTLLNENEVFEDMRQALLQGRWHVDFYVVTARRRCGSGFVVLSQRKRQEIRLEVEGAISAAGVIDIAKAKVGVNASGGTNNFLWFPFSALETPIFESPIGVNRKLWARLLGFKKKGLRVVDPSGHRWPPDEPPWNLRHLDEAERIYSREKFWNLGDGTDEHAFGRAVPASCASSREPGASAPNRGRQTNAGRCRRRRVRSGVASF